MAFKRQKCPEFERLCAAESMSHEHAVGLDGEGGGAERRAESPSVCGDEGEGFRNGGAGFWNAREVC